MALPRPVLHRRRRLPGERGVSGAGGAPPPGGGGGVPARLPRLDRLAPSAALAGCERPARVRLSGPTQGVQAPSVFPTVNRFLYGAFGWARGVLNSQKRWFLARAVDFFNLVPGQTGPGQPRTSLRGPVWPQRAEAGAPKPRALRPFSCRTFYGESMISLKLNCYHIILLRSLSMENQRN
jgi:hypothetical protein